MPENIDYINKLMQVTLTNLTISYRTPFIQANFLENLYLSKQESFLKAIVIRIPLLSLKMH